MANLQFKHLQPLSKSAMKAIVGGYDTHRCLLGSNSCNSNIQCCSNKCEINSKDKITGYTCKGDKPDKV